MDRSPHHTRPQLRNERGVALILVIFIVALASVVVINLAHSTTLSGRMSVMIERRMQSEYLLKSAVNVARVLLDSEHDKTSDSDAPVGTDPWIAFRNGTQIPTSLLGIDIPNISVSLEIAPLDRKISLLNVGPSSSNPMEWRQLLSRLFGAPKRGKVGFDHDNEEWSSSYFPNARFFDSNEMVANLVDYLDKDSDQSTTINNKSGIEDSLPADTFRNEETIDRLEELLQVPGFTPKRVYELRPYVITEKAGYININFAPDAILSVLDPNITPTQIDSIKAFREGKNGGPFTRGNLTNELSSLGITGPSVGLFNSKSDLFEVTAKVDYSTSAYFVRAIIDRGTNTSGSGGTPTIKSIEFY